MRLIQTNLHTLIRLLLIAFVIGIVVGAAISVNAHETETYEHQVGNIHMYGGGLNKETGAMFVWIDAEHTQCVDMLYAHGKPHVTKPYNCDEKGK